MPNAWPTSSLRSQNLERSIDRYYWVALKEWSICIIGSHGSNDRSIGWLTTPPPTTFRWWNAFYEFCDSIGQWILFCVSSLLFNGRQRDFNMLLNCVRAQNSIIQISRLGALQYNNGYWCDQTNQGTSGNLKEEGIFLFIKIWIKSLFFLYF